MSSQPFLPLRFSETLSVHAPLLERTQPAKESPWPEGLAKHAFATLVLLATAVTATAEDFSSLVRGQGIDPATEQFISVVRNGSGASLVKYDLDPFRKGPVLYGEDFVFTNAQQQTTSGRIGFKVRPGKPMPRAPRPPSPPLPAGALPHEIFEFFSKHVVHDKNMAVADDRQGGTYFLVDGWFAYLKDLAANGFKYRALRMYPRRYSAMAWDEGRHDPEPSLRIALRALG